MATSLVRSRATITGTKDRLSWNEVKDGAVLQEDGVIAAVGTYDDLHRKHPTVPVIGTGKEVLVLAGTARFGFRHIVTGATHELVTSGEKPVVVETIPGWTHDITNISDHEMIVMLWANEVFEPERPDTVTMPVRSA